MKYFYLFKNYFNNILIILLKTFGYYSRNNTITLGSFEVLI